MSKKYKVKLIILSDVCNAMQWTRRTAELRPKQASERVRAGIG